MVQDVVIVVYGWIVDASHLLYKSLPLLVALVAVLGALWLGLRKVDSDRAIALEEKAKRLGGSATRLGALGLALLLLCGLIVRAESVVSVRRATILGATASRRNEPSLSGVFQYAPSVAIEEEKTYTRRITLPPDFVNRIGTEGLQVLSPYLTDPTAESVLRLVDNFKRSGQDVVFTRELTRLDETAVPADAADVNIKFDSQGDRSGQRHFTANFAATYKFHNPRDTAMPMRFVFPLPQGGGAIQGFALHTGNETITEPDKDDHYAWRGTVPPNGTVQIQAQYKLTGAGSFDYAIGTQRRRIGEFHLVADCDRIPKFGKAGIFPSSVSGTRSEWRLKDVLTAQNVALVFPRSDISAELLGKSLAIMPVALVLFALGLVWRNPSQALVATCGFGVGLLATPMLASYISPELATLIGGLLAIGCGAWLGGRRVWGFAVAAGLLPISFLSSEHGALVAWVVAAAVLVFCVTRLRRSSVAAE